MVDRTKKLFFFGEMPFLWSYDHNSVYDILSLIWVDNFFQAYDVELSELEKVEGEKDVS